jgi:CRISPR-associated protein Csd1
LYRAALEKLPVPVALLGPVLAEFRAALVTDSKKKPKYPFNQSRFALIKLILTRTPNGGFSPMPFLCDTDDAPYNLGRLLCLMADLQNAAHEYELEGAGVVERYYGTASSAPAGVFAVLWKLHNHHLRKLEQQGDKGQAKASAIRGRIAEIAAKFPPSGPGQSPRFPRQLSLEEQGRFALGFYQQMAADQQARREASVSKKAESM